MPEDVLPWFEAENAYWEYQGEADPAKPHALLISGKHSNGYFDTPRVLRYPNVTEILARQLAMKLIAAGIRADWVISSAYSAITFGHEVAKVMGAKFLNVEKDPTDPDKKRMLWQRQTVAFGEVVLGVEELVTTTSTTEQVRRAVWAGNPVPVFFLKDVGTLILRPEKLLPEYGGLKIAGFIEKEMKNFDPDKCPYCAVGSEAVKPKINWARLTGKA